MKKRKLTKTDWDVLRLFHTDGKCPNYAAIVNAHQELFLPPEEWTILGTKKTPRYYPRFNNRGRAVFSRLYYAGLVMLEFPGLSPDTLQNYCPDDLDSAGCLREGLLKSEE